MLSLEDKTVLVTGASSGIGRAIALALAGQGAPLLLSERDHARLEAAEASRGGRRVTTCRADLSDEADVRRLAHRCAEGDAAVDILIHSAGRLSQGAVEAASAEKLDAQYQTNVRCPFVLTQALLPSVRAQRGQIMFDKSTVSMAARAEISQ